MSDCVTSRKELWAGVGEVLTNRPVGEGVWKISLRAPEFAERVEPGKFVMLRLYQSSDPLLGRPFAVYDADVATGRVEALYAVVGKGTTRMTALTPGDKLELWGPLGNGWNVAKRAGVRRLALIAGGVGIAPFYTLIKELMKRDASERPQTTFVYGARTAARLTCVEEFQALGVDVKVATEDGSVGTRGFVTDVLPEVFAPDVPLADAQILACGPTPMLKAIARWAAARHCECWTSLESPMACGMGICFSCVVNWKSDDGTWDYKRACVDGPVFDAARLKWD